MKEIVFWKEIGIPSVSVANTDDISTTVDDKIGNYINDSVTVEAENFETNYFDDSSDYYTKFSATEETNVIVTPKIRTETDNYYDVSTLQRIINIYYYFPYRESAW